MYGRCHRGTGPEGLVRASVRRRPAAEGDLLLGVAGGGGERRGRDGAALDALDLLLLAALAVVTDGDPRDGEPGVLVQVGERVAPLGPGAAEVLHHPGGELLDPGEVALADQTRAPGRNAKLLAHLPLLHAAVHVAGDPVDGLLGPRRLELARRLLGGARLPDPPLGHHLLHLLALIGGQVLHPILHLGADGVHALAHRLPVGLGELAVRLLAVVDHHHLLGLGVDDRRRGALARGRVLDAQVIAVEHDGGGAAAAALGDQGDRGARRGAGQQQAPERQRRQEDGALHRAIIARPAPAVDSPRWPKTSDQRPCAITPRAASWPAWRDGWPSWPSTTGSRWTRW